MANGIQIAGIPSPQEERRIAGIKECGRREVEEEDEQLAAALWNLCLCLLYHDPQVVDNVLGGLLSVDQKHHNLMCGGMGEGVKELLHAALGLDSRQLMQHQLLSVFKHKLFDEVNHLLILFTLPLLLILLGNDRAGVVFWKLVEEWGRTSVAEQLGGTQVSVPGGVCK